MGYTSPTGAIISRAYAKFRATAYVAMVCGNLASWYTSGNEGLVLADVTGPQLANCVCIEDVVAGAKGWFAMAAEVTAPPTALTSNRGTPTAGVLGLAADVGKPLYLGATGLATLSADGSVNQAVGWISDTDKALFVPGLSLSGTTLSLTNMTASGASSSTTLAVSGTSALAGVATFTAKPVLSAGLTLPAYMTIGFTVHTYADTGNIVYPAGLGVLTKAGAQTMTITGTPTAGDILILYSTGAYAHKVYWAAGTFDGTNHYLDFGGAVTDCVTLMFTSTTRAFILAQSGVTAAAS